MKWLKQVSIRKHCSVWILSSLIISLALIWWQDALAGSMLQYLHLVIIGIFLVIYIDLVRQELGKNKALRQGVQKKESDFQLLLDLIHELRTPLHLILGPACELKKHQHHWSPQEQEYLRILLDNTHKLEERANDLLALHENLTALNLQVEPVEAVGLIKKVFNGFKYKAFDKKIRYNFSTSFHSKEVWADSRIWVGVFYRIINFIFDAIPDQSSLSVHMDMNESNNIEIRLEASKTIETERFLRALAENSAWDSEFIKTIKKSLSLHQGITRIEVHDKNCVLVIQFPIDGVSYGKSEELKSFFRMNNQFNRQDLFDYTNKDVDISYDPLKLHTSNKKLMLVVEDDEDMRNFIKISFQDDFELAMAATLEACMTIINQTLPDVIICSMLLPGQGGMIFCSKLKRNEMTAHIPLILLTQSDTYQVCESILQSDTDDSILKPFEMKHLKEKVKAILAYREQIQVVYKPQPTTWVVDNSMPSFQGGREEEERFVEQARKAMEENIHKFDFGVAQLCREMGMSKASFYRKLQAILGLSPSQFIRNIRLKKACQLIQMHQYPIMEVAMMVGFKDAKYFSQLFKRHFNLYPTEFDKFNQVDLAKSGLSEYLGQSA